MTEEEWLATKDQAVRLEYVWPRVSQRKLQLYFCGSCRRHSELYYRESSFEYLATAERFADGLASEEALWSANYGAEGDTFGCDFDPEFRADHPEEKLETIRQLVRLGALSETVLSGGEWLVDEEVRARILDAAVALEITTSFPQESLPYWLTNPNKRGHWPGRWLSNCVFGNPFRPVVADPAWLTPTVVSIAAVIYSDRAFDRLPILADALEEAGCTNADILLHCRQPGEHVRGCWAVDLVLGKV